VKKNVPCDYDWSALAGVDQSDVGYDLQQHCDGMEDVLQCNQSGSLERPQPSPALPEIGSAIDSNFVRPTTAEAGNANDIELVPSDNVANWTPPTLSSIPERDDSEIPGAHLDFDTSGLQNHGFDTGFAEDTLTYTDFLNDLLNLQGPGDVVHWPHSDESREKTNIWDKHLNINQSFDELLDFSMSDLMSSVTQAEPSASAVRKDGCVIRYRLADRTSFEERASVAGAQAFKESGWNWTPDHTDKPSVEQDEVSLSMPHDWTTDGLRRDASLARQPLTMKDRDRVILTLSTFSDKLPLVRIATHFPGAHDMESMLHGFLRHQLIDTFSWFHVPTWSLAGFRDELLAALIAFGATLTHLEVIQKLGHAIADILRCAVLDQVFAVAP
jgi:hypothetical protein